MLTPCAASDGDASGITSLAASSPVGEDRGIPSERRRRKDTVRMSQNDCIKSQVGTMGMVGLAALTAETPPSTLNSFVLERCRGARPKEVSPILFVHSRVLTPSRWSL